MSEHDEQQPTDTHGDIDTERPAELEDSATEQPEGSSDDEQGASSDEGGSPDDSNDSADGDDDDDDSDDGESEEEAAERAREEERQREEFARQHDPADHDVAAGADFRQPGDWSADEHGGPQVVESDGTVTAPDDGADQEGADAEHDGGGSDLEDIRDGGHGWGSAAPLDDGRTPLGHPVKAWDDTMTFVLPGEEGYEGSDPHVWFTDGETAARAGYRHAHG